MADIPNEEPTAITPHDSAILYGNDRVMFKTFGDFVPNSELLTYRQLQNTGYLMLRDYLHDGVGYPIVGVYPAGGGDLQQLIYCDELIIFDLMDLDEQIKDLQMQGLLNENGGLVLPLASPQLTLGVRNMVDDTLRNLISFGFDHGLEAQTLTVKRMLAHMILMGANLESIVFENDESRGAHVISFDIAGAAKKAYYYQKPISPTDIKGIKTEIVNFSSKNSKVILIEKGDMMEVTPQLRHIFPFNAIIKEGSDRDPSNLVIKGYRSAVPPFSLNHITNKPTTKYALEELVPVQRFGYQYFSNIKIFFPQ